MLTFFLTMTNTVNFQNIDLSSQITHYAILRAGPVSTFQAWSLICSLSCQLHDSYGILMAGTTNSMFFGDETPYIC
jgi:hypothetical protein